MNTVKLFKIVILSALCITLSHDVFAAAKYEQKTLVITQAVHASADEVARARTSIGSQIDNALGHTRPVEAAVAPIKVNAQLREKNAYYNNLCLQVYLIQAQLTLEKNSRKRAVRTIELSQLRENLVAVEAHAKLDEAKEQQMENRRLLEELYHSYNKMLLANTNRMLAERRALEKATER